MYIICVLIEIFSNLKIYKETDIMKRILLVFSILLSPILLTVASLSIINYFYNPKEITIFENSYLYFWKVPLQLIESNTWSSSFKNTAIKIGDDYYTIGIYNTYLRNCLFELLMILVFICILCNIITYIIFKNIIFRK